jgi:hypothetical protein
MKKLFLLMTAVSFFFSGGLLVRAQTTFGEYATRDGWRLLEIGKALAQMPGSGAKPEDFVLRNDWRILCRTEKKSSEF